MPRNRKSSSLSFRLNPEFDPKELVHQSGKNNIELDPKTIEFNELVNLLHPYFISDYLHKILSYLSSDSIELSFPNIAPYKEAFLLKIVQNNEYFKCTEKFNESARVLAKQILTVIEVNKNVYKWMYLYDSGPTNVLVYKKVYNFSKNNSNNTQTSSTQSSVFKRPQPATNTSTSLASSLEDLNLNTKPATLPTSFKLNTLNTLLKFIKDPNRTIFVFPELPLPEAEFVYKITNHNNNEPVEFGFKPLYATLFESMDKVAMVFNIVTSYLSRGSSSAQVCIEKVPKRIPAQINDQVCIEKVPKRIPAQINEPDHNVSLESSKSRDNVNLPKDMRRKKVIIDNVQGDFIKSTLVAMLEFIRDAQRASLDFKECCPTEATFLESLTSFIRRPENQSLFTQDCALLLQSIKNTRCDGWKLQLVVGKACKNTKRRTITFYKFPRSKQSKKNQKDTISNGNKSNNIIIQFPRDGCKERSVTKQPVYQHNITPKQVVQKESNSEPMRKETNVPSQKVSNPAANRSISLDRGIRNPATPTVDSVPQNNSMNNSPRNQSRQSRLIEGLTTPLESERAERMMRLMGWEGGPLGQRGDGITEPIMPALHLSPGAGLGHVKKVQRTPLEFQRALLQKMIELLQTEQDGGFGSFVSYKDQLTKKEGSFVVTALQAFNERHSDGLSLLNEVLPLVAKVLQELCKNDKLTIQAEISKDKKQIHLRKKFSLNPIIIIKKKKITAEPKLSKAEKSLAHRISFLEAIKDFLYIRNPEKYYDFGFNLAKKHKKFISNVVLMVNRRDSKNTFSSSEENWILGEIFSAATDSYLSVKFYNQNILLQKKYYQNRFKNSALNLPPPKSKDIKNTVIYNNFKENINNIEVKIQSNVHHSDSDDDVIIIENKREIIIISDSEDEKDDERKISQDVTDGAVKLLPKPTKDVIEETSSESNLVTPVTKESTLINNFSDNVATLVEISKQAIITNKISTDETNSLENTNYKNSEGSGTEEKSPSIEVIHLNVNSSVAIEDVSETTKTIISSNNDMVTPDITDSETANFEDISSLVTPDTDDLDYIDCENTSGDVSLNSSDETLLLEFLENENNSCDTKNIKLENDLDQDIIDLEQAIFDSDFSTGIKKELNLDLVKTESIETAILNKLEINNNCDLDVNLDDAVNISEINFKFSSDCDSIDLNDNSSNTSKRLRTNSSDSANSTKRYKVASKHHICITPKSGDIDLEIIKRVQKMISKEIDNNSFMPLLKCHSVQNGGLIYGCHDDKTLLWLVNVISVASDLKTTEIEFSECKNYKVMIKIFSCDSVENNLKMISKYNDGLKTDNWVIRNVEFNKDYQLITVVIDEDSYNYISMYNFSLFAGGDMARFSLVWD